MQSTNIEGIHSHNYDELVFNMQELTSEMNIFMFSSIHRIRPMLIGKRCGAGAGGLFFLRWLQFTGLVLSTSQARLGGRGGRGVGAGGSDVVAASLGHLCITLKEIFSAGSGKRCVSEL